MTHLWNWWWHISFDKVSGGNWVAFGLYGIEVWVTPIIAVTTVVFSVVIGIPYAIVAMIRGKGLGVEARLPLVRGTTT